MMSRGDAAACWLRGYRGISQKQEGLRARRCREQVTGCAWAAGKCRARLPSEGAARDCRRKVSRETATGRCRGHISGAFRACRGRDFAFLADQSAHFGDLVSHFVSLYTTNQASAADQIRIFAEMVCQRTPTEAPANAKPLKNAAFLFSLYKIWQTKNQFLALWSATFPKNSKKSGHLASKSPLHTKNELPAAAHNREKFRYHFASAFAIIKSCNFSMARAWPWRSSASFFCTS